MMGDLLERVMAQRDALKKLIAKLPGFKGYYERADRRSADKLLRETISDKFQAQWARLSSIQRELIAGGHIEVMDEIETGAIRLRQFIDRVKTAAYGYSGLFDATKINEAELDKVYQYDLTLLELADEIASAIDNLEASIGSDGLPAAIRNVNQKAQDCLDAFNQRSELFKFGG
ncbi:MAG TPA: hypothetical protein PKZ26_09810 [Anaerolineaceae bacterium]|jgi:hypothetical protein|nr:hypothetical protein [Anaerolineaceae bacterium]HPD63544.1 hypothetical protein [Anaerolineaceae bacterium]HQM54886.1 hypothetical protein [Anaerolineaceae bacterium]HRT92349.1 hypothetical protein [Anaerolineaceae bacterium]HUM63950.1 hypothetical protein [Anaerolineaceae bacterium]